MDIYKPIQVVVSRDYLLPLGSVGFDYLRLHRTLPALNLLLIGTEIFYKDEACGDAPAKPQPSASSTERRRSIAKGSIAL